MSERKQAPTVTWPVAVTLATLTLLIVYLLVVASSTVILAARWLAGDQADPEVSVPLEEHQGHSPPDTVNRQSSDGVLVGDENLMGGARLVVLVTQTEIAEEMARESQRQLELEAKRQLEREGTRGPQREPQRGPQRGDEPGPSIAVDSSHPFLVCTRRHESDTAGGYQAVDGTGTHRGAYQFRQTTWDATASHAGRPDLVGVRPDLASPADQDAMALHLYQWEGNKHWGGRC